MRRVAIAVALALSALMSLACGQEEEAAPPTPTQTASTSAPATATSTPESEPASAPSSGWKFFGWGDVVLYVPDGPDIYVATAQIVPAAPGQGRAIQIIRDTNPADLIFSHVLIDAETGQIVEQEVEQEDRQAIDEVLATVRISPFDPAKAPWPFSGEPPDARRADGTFTYIVPSPEARLELGSSLGDPGGRPGLALSNGRSTLVVGLDPETGRLITEFHGDERDRGPFERWLREVRACVSVAEC